LDAEQSTHGGAIKVKTSSILIRCGLSSLLVLGLLIGCNRGPSDEALTQSVQAKIKADAQLATAPISVSTAKGVVSLTGEVTSAANKSHAEGLAKSVDGVKSVTNNITVKLPPAPVIAQDDPLKTQVMANLIKYGISGITVSVANGEVTLTGNIARAKLQDAMKAANEAHPKKVNNKLTIK
jgi:osmotically-inducible protein OsmY